MTSDAAGSAKPPGLEQGVDEAAQTDESDSTSMVGSGFADRLDELIYATLDLILGMYLRKVENGERDSAESELTDALARARTRFTGVPAPADTTTGPWGPLIANSGEDDERSYWGRPVYWLNRPVLEQLSVVVMGTQAWGQASENVSPEVLVDDTDHRPYTEDWWRFETLTASKAREISEALAEAADRADAVEFDRVGGRSRAPQETDRG